MLLEVLSWSPDTLLMLQIESGRLLTRRDALPRVLQLWLQTGRVGAYFLKEVIVFVCTCSKANVPLRWGVGGRRLLNPFQAYEFESTLRNMGPKR